jgi:hypothetical protein
VVVAVALVAMRGHLLCLARERDNGGRRNFVVRWSVSTRRLKASVNVWRPRKLRVANVSMRRKMLGKGV